ncbi:glutamate-cysteine ligase family protein [Streptomyces johnsoniae]|uniref:glutamate--cysteine ligase n=1 Tax=Streptomyces johnsoniae TaxID=3075532 RepID=A0ABU2RYJ5_9ACTN|nr:glutamate-cysteine ligase family protein [Streptomyces sp. DSM 41886]MDT0441697.1 glutamate-cysteine ligase family protein [Streptomyces sp. DSM 41886]
MELEWLVDVDGGGTGERSGAGLTESVSLLARRAGARLPGDSLVSLEPGGQLELSTRPAGSLSACVERAATDLATLRALATAQGLVLRGAGLDDRPPRLRIAHPRYLALDQYYRQVGGQGRALLCSTASVQINVDAGDHSSGWRGRNRRWALVNVLGPVFMAMFANSPTNVRGRQVRSGRQVLRLATDPARSGPLPPSDDPRSLWAEHALGTRVVAVRSPENGVWEVPCGRLTLRRWLRGGGPRPVHASDVRAHLKSLVTPVRACGHLELRMIDAQGGDDWVVPLAVVAVLLDDAQSSDAVWRLLGASTVASGRTGWRRAAETGLSDPALAMAARTVMHVALEGLPRLGVPSWALDAVERYADDYTLRGLSPADRRPAGSAAVA